MKPEHDVIRKMPKIELHLHLEGSFTFEFLYDLIQKYGGDPSVEKPEDLEKKFIFKDFQHFIDLWFWKNKFFKNPKDFENCTYATLENLSKQNVLYAEVFYSPWDFVNNGLSVEEITEATLEGILKAKNDFSIKCNLIADIVRDYGAENAIDRILQVKPYQNQGVVGIGLGGNEIDFPPNLFKEAFERARREDFHVVAHAGEAAGPLSVWQALKSLQAERIGHGVKAVEDPDLIRYLQSTQTPLELCVISNQKTKVFPSDEIHPVKKMFDDGLNITINSDDPAMFGGWITDEFINLFDNFGFSLNEIHHLTLNAVNASFLNIDKKQELLQSIEDYWSKTPLDL